MQVILTPTAVADMFGVGLHGFKGSIPPLPPPTELSAEWFNSMQMELVNLILGQGIALDGMVFDQLKQAIDDYSFVDPSISGSLTIENGALLDVLSGGALVMRNGSTFAVESNVVFQVETSLATFLGDLVIGTASADALIVVSTATFQSPAYFGGHVEIGNNPADLLTVYATSTFNEPVTFADDIDFGTNTILGTGGTITTGTVNADVVAPTEVRWDSIPGVLPTTNGRSSYDGRTLTIGDGVRARRFHTPVEVYVVSHAMMGAIIDIPGASVTMDIDPNEWVYVKISAAHVLSGGDTFTVLIAATNGVDNVVVLNSGDDDTASYGFTFGAAQKITQGMTIRWKPTNDIAVPNNNNWTLKVRHDISGANTLTTSNILLQVWYDPT
jgi:acetyltransferase-like isoleucine patch superfamily enzyme